MDVHTFYRRIREQLGPGEVEATESGTAAVSMRCVIG